MFEPNEDFDGHSWTEAQHAERFHATVIAFFIYAAAALSAVAGLIAWIAP